MENKKYIEPSLLSLDKDQLKAMFQINQLQECGIEYVHYDVMDGEFVENTSFTNEEYLEILKQKNFKINVHLMVANPKKWINKYIKYNVNAITFHIEPKSLKYSKKIMNKIKKHNIMTGFAIKYITDVNAYESLLPLCDFITVMSVNPGKGGQGFCLESLDNLKKLESLKQKYPQIKIQLDGGVDFEIMKKYYQYVDFFISGSYIFKNLDKLPKIIEDFNKLEKK